MRSPDIASTLQYWTEVYQIHETEAVTVHKRDCARSIRTVFVGVLHLSGSKYSHRPLAIGGLIL